MKWVND